MLNSSAGTITNPTKNEDTVVSPKQNEEMMENSSGETNLRTKSRIQNIKCGDNVNVKLDSRVGSRYDEY